MLSCEDVEELEEEEIYALQLLKTTLRQTHSLSDLDSQKFTNRKERKHKKRENR
jgi:hypothetical protein